MEMKLNKLNKFNTKEKRVTNKDIIISKDEKFNGRHGENRKVPTPRKNIEMKICGIHACLMAFEKRPQDIVRVYLTEDNLKQFSKVLKYCVNNKLAYRVLSNEELTKVSESNHHEGVCYLIKKLPSLSLHDYLNSQSSVDKNMCIVALEKVQNPHNLGAVMRVCANFGVNAILVSNAEAAISGATFRTSEGGAEFAKIITTDNFEKAVHLLRANNYKILTTSSHVGKSIFEEKIPEKIVIIFGSESNGLTDNLLRSGDKIVKIPSTGNVESLNIACATSIILAEYWRVNKNSNI